MMLMPTIWLEHLIHNTHLMAPQKDLWRRRLWITHDFLLSLKEENITGYSAPIAWNYAEDSQLQDRAEFPGESSEIEKFHSPELTASRVMGWLTGQRHREMNGKKVQITVNSDHDCKIRAPNHTVCFPYVGACGMEITLPNAHMTNYEDFRHVFMLAYCKGQAFAKP